MRNCAIAAQPVSAGLNLGAARPTARREGYTMLDRTAETAESICQKLHRLRIKIEAICYDVIPLKPNETKDGRVAALQQEESAEYARLSATPSACLVDLSAKTDELHRVVVDSDDGDFLDGRLAALAKSVAEDTRRLADDEFNRPDKAAA